MRRGNIFYFDLAEPKGSEQGGFRPGIVIQNDTGNIHSPTTIIVPITTSPCKKCLPVHMKLGDKYTRFGLSPHSLVLFEQIRVVDVKLRRKDYICSLDDEDIQRLNRMCKVSLGLD